MQLAKKFVPFLKKDETGNHGVVVSAAGKNISLDLEEGVTLKIEADGVEVRMGDKVYFNDEGAMTKVVAAPRKKAERQTTPRSGCARVHHPY